jgi:hypothetical protein
MGRKRQCSLEVKTQHFNNVRRFKSNFFSSAILSSSLSGPKRQKVEWKCVVLNETRRVAHRPGAHSREGSTCRLYSHSFLLPSYTTRNCKAFCSYVNLYFRRCTSGRLPHLHFACRYFRFSLLQSALTNVSTNC